MDYSLLLDIIGKVVCYREILKLCPQSSGNTLIPTGVLT